jgi:integrase/recombinase XerC
MARRLRPWFRAARNAWFGTVDGKQVDLQVSGVENEAKAWAALEAILAARRAPDKPAPKTVSEVATAFLADAAGRVKPKTLKGYRWYVGQLVARFGTLPWTDLDADRLTADARRASWSSSTRHNYLSTAETLIHFAGGKLRLRKPPKQSAGAASVIPEPVFRRVLAHCSGDWYAYVLFLWHTGARPGEGSAARAEDVDRDNRLIRLREHKTVGATGADRLIYLNDDAWEVVGWQLAKYADGPLFRGYRGRPFSPMAVVNRFLRISDKVNHRVTAYCLRHTYATRALASGLSDALVAELLGHRGTAMVGKHYAHLGEMGRQLREAAARVGRAG